MLKSKIIFISLLSSLFFLLSTRESQAQDNDFFKSDEFGPVITTKFKFLSSNFSLGYEFQVKKRQSLKLSTEIDFFLLPSTAFILDYKYYFMGKVGEGIYVKPNIQVGYFFKQTIDDRVMFGGLGASIGGMIPFSIIKNSYIYGDMGLRYPFTFGPIRVDSQKNNTFLPFSLLYKSCWGAFSILDISIGFAYKF